MRILRGQEEMHLGGLQEAPGKRKETDPGLWTSHSYGFPTRLLSPIGELWAYQDCLPLTY